MKHLILRGYWRKGNRTALLSLSLSLLHSLSLYFFLVFLSHSLPVFLSLSILVYLERVFVSFSLYMYNTRLGTTIGRVVQSEGRVKRVEVNKGERQRERKRERERKRKREEQRIASLTKVNKLHPLSHLCLHLCDKVCH